MEDDLVTATIVDTSDFTVLGLFLKADIVVKSVMLVLIVALYGHGPLCTKRLKCFDGYIRLPMNLKVIFGQADLLRKYTIRLMTIPTTLLQMFLKLQWLK